MKTNEPLELGTWKQETKKKQKKKNKKKKKKTKKKNKFCVEVLRPSQPNGVMSSAVSLPNHTFTGQA